MEVQKLHVTYCRLSYPIAPSHKKTKRKFEPSIPSNSIKLHQLSSMTAIVAIATKESKEQKCGIGLTNQHLGKGPVLITSITEDGLFAGSALVIGMEVKTINNQSVATSSEAVAMLKEAEGQVILVADLAIPTPTAEKVVSPTESGPVDAPPGVSAGGQWGKNNYMGEKTGAAACLGCLCFCLPGLCVLMCPLDERDAYKYGDKVYDASGNVIGPAQNTKFMPTAHKMAR